MPWHKVPNSSQCPSDQPWAVVKDSDGSLAGCHSSESDADKQLAALYANEANMNLQDMVKQFQQGNPQALIDWYNDGADGAINWGEDGDFEDCVAIAGEHGLESPEGFCQERHMDATGEPAGKGAHGGASMPTKQFGAIGAHSTATDDESDWDAGAALSNVNATPDNLKAMHAYQDPEGDPEAKGTYSFPHHNVNADGSVGAANTSAASAGIAALNGGRSGHSLSTDDKIGVHNHLAKHLEDAGKEAPPLKGAGASEQRASTNPANQTSTIWVGFTADGEPIKVVDDGAPPIEVAEDSSFEMPIMAIEGAWTGDWRYIEPGALSWRGLPIPAMALTTTTFDHNSAKLVGRIDTIDRGQFGEEDLDIRTGQPYSDGAGFIKGDGKFTTMEDGKQIQSLVKDQFLRGVSIDLGDTVSEYVWVYADGTEVPEDEMDDWDIWDLLFGFTADGEEAKDQEMFLAEKILSGRVMGATICPFPAFEGAYVTVGDVAMAASAAAEGELRMPSVNVVRVVSNRQAHGLTAAAPIKPPAPWFKDPEFDGPTAITIEDSGQFYGHLAIWGQQHMGYQGRRIIPPHSRHGYAYFHTKSVMCDDGQLIPTGLVTMNTGHAELWQEMDEAKAHYDNTGFATVDVRAGEDAYGIWLAGALRPDIDELSIRRLRGATLSGDWREYAGGSELIAALAVNVPGFPIVRPKVRVASGQVFSMVAAGRVTPLDVKRLRERGHRGEMAAKGVLMEAKPDPTLVAATQILDRQARRALRDEVHPSTR